MRTHVGSFSDEFGSRRTFDPDKQARAPMWFARAVWR
jgi:hypothetical protein